MHELGIIIEIVKRVESLARQHQLAKVEKIVLQIGECSSALPHFIRQCYPAAVHGTSLSACQLEIETVLAKVRCRQCKTIYPLRRTRGYCSHCHAKDYDILCGNELVIKEILVADHKQEGA